MKVTGLAIVPPPAAANLPKVTPELLASVLARYSRSNQGIGAILDKVDLANPDASIDYVKARDGIINVDLEKRRLMYALQTVMFTPEVAAAGVGDVNDERLKRSVAQLAAVFELPRQPAPAEVFDRRFLPPLTERRLSLK